MRQRITRRSKVLLGLAIAMGITGALAQPPSGTARPAAARPQADRPTDAPLAITPAEQRELKEALPRYLRSLEAGMRSSKFPRDRALSTQVMQFDAPFYMPAMGTDPTRGELLRNAAEAAPRDHLVQWIWANASAGASGCTHANPCPDRGRALAKLEPDNGAAWIPAVAFAFQDHDEGGTDEALARMAAAKGYDDKAHELEEAWDEIIRRYPPPKLPSTIPGIEQPKPGDSDPGFVKTLVAMQGASVGLSTMSMAESCEREAMCRADPRRGASCAKAARLLLDQGDSYMTKAAGAGILESSAFATAEDRMRIRDLTWQVVQYRQLMRSARDDPATALRLSEDSRSEGEVARMLEQLSRAHVPLTPPAGWNPPVDPESPFKGCDK
jgi:hypothetical protein